MNLTKQEIKGLPNSPIGNESNSNVADYVNLIYSKKTKREALEIAYPDRYKRAVDRADGNELVINANITKEINQIERSSYCKKLYGSSHKDWWIKFLQKKEKLLDNMYDTAMDSGENTKDRIAASKVFFEYIPKFEEDKTLKVEVTVTDDDFKQQLLEKKRKLYQAANDEEIIDVSVEPEGS